MHATMVGARTMLFCLNTETSDTTAKPLTSWSWWKHESLGIDVRYGVYAKYMTIRCMHVLKWNENPQIRDRRCYNVQDGQTQCKSLWNQLYPLHENVNMKEIWCWRYAFFVLPKDLPKNAYHRGFQCYHLCNIMPSKSWVTTQQGGCICCPRSQSWHVSSIHWMLLETFSKTAPKIIMILCRHYDHKVLVCHNQTQEYWIRILVYPPCIPTIFATLWFFCVVTGVSVLSPVF